MEDGEQCLQFFALLTQELTLRLKLTDLKLAFEFAQSLDKHDNVRVSEHVVHLLVLNEHCDEAVG
jgi:hypothetical protein